MLAESLGSEATGLGFRETPVGVAHESARREVANALEAGLRWRTVIEAEDMSQRRIVDLARSEVAKLRREQP